MAAPQSLGRLHSIREAEERQLRAQMESAMAALRRLQNVLDHALERAKQARALIASSVRSGELLDRIGALQEIKAAEHAVKTLPARIAAAENDVASIRHQFLTKRIERRQIESLLEAARACKVVENNRKSQSALDDWHHSRQVRKKKSSVPVTSEI